jgi:hypothetical protein
MLPKSSENPDGGFYRLGLSQLMGTTLLEECLKVHMAN